MRRIDCKYFLVRGCSFFDPVKCYKRIAKIEMSFKVMRPERDRLLAMCDRLLMMAERHKRAREVVVRLGVGRIELERFLELGNTLLGPLKRRQRITQIIVRLGVG